MIDSVLKDDGLQGSLHIGGEFSPGHGATHDVIYPGNGQAFAQISHASVQDVDDAITAARSAQLKWSAMSAGDRGVVLARAASIIRTRNEELSRIETMDTGKPIQETLVADALSGADALDHYANRADDFNPQRGEETPDYFTAKRVAHGVVGAIGAWNYPMQIACWKAAPALMCGNTMVFKPSELTPLSALMLADIFAEAGLPAGCFNVVQGAGDIGAALASHRGIDKVSVTGSVATGRKVYQAAADNLVPVTLELGGKSPILVMEDADIDNAVTGAMLGNFYSTGQICSNGTRVFVARTVLDAFLDQLTARTANLTMGDPLNPHTMIGPLVSAAQRDRVMGFIAAGKRSATLVHGGEQPIIPGSEGGYYIEPTIFLTEQDDMAIVRDEIFGPVMTVLPFDDEEEAISRANDTMFGLSAGVYSSDFARAQRVVDQLSAGTCWINAYNLTPVAMPFGGMKASGIGRENGIGGIEAYSQWKSVYVGTGSQDTPY